MSSTTCSWLQKKLAEIAYDKNNERIDEVNELLARKADVTATDLVSCEFAKCVRFE